MALIADAGGIYGLYDRRDSAHARIRAVVERERDHILIPSPVLGEIDYLLRSRLGLEALSRFLLDIGIGAFDVEAITPDDLERCAVLVAKHSNLDLGLCDASVIAVAERLRVDRILTVDERDLRVVGSFLTFRFLPGGESQPGHP
jgi:predicted nucleic acid-binding protein